MIPELFRVYMIYISTEVKKNSLKFKNKTNDLESNLSAKKWRFVRKWVSGMDDGRLCYIMYMYGKLSLLTHSGRGKTQKYLVEWHSIIPGATTRRYFSHSYLQMCSMVIQIKVLSRTFEISILRFLAIFFPNKPYT